MILDPGPRKTSFDSINFGGILYFSFFSMGAPEKYLKEILWKNFREIATNLLSLICGVDSSSVGLPVKIWNWVWCLQSWSRFQFPCDCFSGASLNLQFTDLESRQLATTPRSWADWIWLSYASVWVGTGASQCRNSNVATNSYLVDPASSHMLVSKIKPCMSKYKPHSGETANGSLNHT